MPATKIRESGKQVEALQKYFDGISVHVLKIEATSHPVDENCCRKTMRIVALLWESRASLPQRSSLIVSPTSEGRGSGIPTVKLASSQAASVNHQRVRLAPRPTVSTTRFTTDCKDVAAREVSHMIIDEVHEWNIANSKYILQHILIANVFMTEDIRRPWIRSTLGIRILYN